MKLATILFVSALALAPLAHAQTTAAESPTTARVLAYIPGIGLIPVATDSTSLPITCPTPATCIIKAVSGTPVPPPVLTQVICEPHPVTAQQNVFLTGSTPVGAVQVIKNGIYLMNIGGADYSVSGSTVTLTQAQTAQAGDGVCFTYQHQ